MDPLYTHPSKCSQEEIVQQASDKRTEPLMCALVNPDEEYELGHEEAAAQVLVDHGSGVLDVSEEPEGEDTHGQADDGDHHSQLRYSRQNIVVCKQIGLSRGHENSEVCQVITGT